MDKEYLKIKKAIASKAFQPVYFLGGSVSFFIDDLVKLLEGTVLSVQEKSFNQSIFYGKDIKVSQVLDAARRFPMMSKYQLIVVKEAQTITDIKQKQAQQQLEEYIKNPIPSTVLVFSYKNGKPDGRQPWVQVLKKSGFYYESKAFYDNQLPDFVSFQAKNIGLNLTIGACQIVAELVGNDLSRISNELKKLQQGLTDDEISRAEIGPEIVTRIISASKEFNVFELQKALGAKNSFKCFQIVKFFSQNIKDHSIIPMVALLYGFFMKILIMHQYKGGDQNTLLQKMNLRSSYFLKDYQKAQSNYSVNQCIYVIQFLKEADLNVKGVDSVKKEEEILKELMIKILSV